MQVVIDSIEECTRALEAAPEEPMWLARRGSAKLKLWRLQLASTRKIPSSSVLLETALADFKSCVGSEDAPSWAYVKLGVCLIFLIRWTEAVQVLKKRQQQQQQHGARNDAFSGPPLPSGCCRRSGHEIKSKDRRVSGGVIGS